MPPLRVLRVSRYREAAPRRLSGVGSLLRESRLRITGPRGRSLGCCLITNRFICARQSEAHGSWNHQEALIKLGCESKTFSSGSTSFKNPTPAEGRITVSSLTLYCGCGVCIFTALLEQQSFFSILYFVICLSLPLQTQISSSF